jgi:hypothetical protein
MKSRWFTVLAGVLAEVVFAGVLILIGWLTAWLIIG